MQSDETADPMAHFAVGGSCFSALSKATPIPFFPLMLVLLKFFCEPIHNTKLELNQLTQDSSVVLAQDRQALHSLGDLRQ